MPRIRLFLPAFACLVSLTSFGCGEPAQTTPEAAKANMTEADKAEEAALSKRIEENNAKASAKKH